MTTQLSPLAVQRFYDNAGNLAVGGLLYTYQAGTTTPQATYTDSTGITPNANPIVLNSRGEAGIWLTSGQSYKFVLKDASSNTLWTVDNITGPDYASYLLSANLASTSDVAKGSALIGFKLNYMGGVGRLLSLKLTDWVSVRDFGAVGDGTTNDTAAFVAAIAAVAPTLPGNPWDLNGAAGATVFVPAGKYKISPDQIVVPSWVNLVGAGKSTAILSVASAGTTALSMGTLATPSYHTSVKGLTIYGNSLNVTGLTIYASFWMTDDIEVTRCNYNGIYTYSSYTGKAYNTYSFYNATSAGYAGILCDGAGVGTGTNDVTFFGGSIGNCYDNIRINNGNGVYIESLSIQSASRIGINLQANASGVTIRDSYFEANVLTVDGASIYGALNFVTIDNCYFTSTGSSHEQKYIAGSTFNGCRITNNTFGNLTPTAFIGLVNEATGSCTFVRNTIRGNASADDSIPLFTPALKVFVDAALYAVDTATLNRVEHLTQYMNQVSGIKSYVVTLTPSTSGTITLDPTQNTAVYTKIDKMVHVQGRVLVTSVASPVGTNIKLSLPFAIATLPQASGKIGGTLVDTSTTVRAFTGDEGNSFINVFLTAASVTGGMYYSFSFSYLSV